MDKKPKIFCILKIVGFVGVAIAITGFILVGVGFGDFESNNFMIGGFLSAGGVFMAISGLVVGFRPEIAKLSIQSNKYIQQQNNTAEIRPVWLGSVDIFSSKK